MQVFGDRGGGAARGFTDAAAQARVQPSGFPHSVLKLLHPIPAGHTWAIVKRAAVITSHFPAMLLWIRSSEPAVPF